MAECLTPVYCEFNRETQSKTIKVTRDTCKVFLNILMFLRGHTVLEFTVDMLLNLALLCKCQGCQLLSLSAPVLKK